MGNDPLKPPPIIRQSEGAGKEDATARILIFSYFHKLFPILVAATPMQLILSEKSDFFPFSKDWSLQREAAARFLRSLSTAVNGKTAPVESREACGEELFPFTQVCNSVLFLIPQLVQ